MTDLGEVNERDSLRILLIDDHIVLTDALKMAIEKISDFIVEEANSIESAIKIIENGEAVDLVLLDYQLQGTNGLDGMKLLQRRCSCGIALFSGVAPLPIIERAIELGARGFIPKSIRIPAMIHAIKLMILGEVFLSIGSTLGMKQMASAFNLKQRELGVLRLVFEGLPNKAIAQQLDMSVANVAADVKSLCRKLKVRNRTQLVMEAQRVGLM
jgi:two-component system, NarL family, nitrate/nitrite response regulator NarL